MTKLPDQKEEAKKTSAINVLVTEECSNDQTIKTKQKEASAKHQLLKVYCMFLRNFQTMYKLQADEYGWYEKTYLCSLLLLVQNWHNKQTCYSVKSKNMQYT